ncbi:MAG: hypothetical protein AAF958_04310, partial [Planctomycetota bacterium]
ASGRCVAVDDLANALARVPNRCFLEHTGASGRFIDKQSDCPGVVTVSRNSVDWTPVAKVNSADDNSADDNSATDDEINAIVESFDRAWVAQQRGPRQVESFRRKNRSERHTMNVGGSIQQLRFSNDSRSLWLLTPRNLVRCDLESGVVRQTISFESVDDSLSQFCESPQGRWLAIRGRDHLHLCRGDDQRPWLTLPSERTGDWFTFSPDDSTLITHDSVHLYVEWSLKELERLIQATSPELAIRAGHEVARLFEAQPASRRNPRKVKL